jgi:hypothetical protein
MTEEDEAWGPLDKTTRALYLTRRVDKAFVQQALNAPYKSLWQPHVYDVMRSGFAAAWWTVSE